MTDLEAALKHAERAIRESTIEAAKHFGQVDFVVKSADPGDWVTELDKSTENTLKTSLGEFDSSIGFWGEESGKSGATDRYWLIDPIDGTNYFVRGVPWTTTIVALIEDKKPVVGCIYNFVTDEMFAAFKDGGATLNGATIQVSKRDFPAAYIEIESHLAQTGLTDLYAALFDEIGVQHTNTAGYRMAMMARGHIEGIISYDPYGKEWDYAAGALLISEAGGVVHNFGKDDFTVGDNNFIAASPSIYDELLQRFKKATGN